MIVNIQDNEIQIGIRGNNKIDSIFWFLFQILLLRIENYGYNFLIKLVHSLDNICDCQQSFVIQIYANFGYLHLHILYNLKDGQKYMTLLGKTIDKFLIST